MKQPSVSIIAALAFAALAACPATAPAAPAVPAAPGTYGNYGNNGTSSVLLALVVPTVPVVPVVPQVPVVPVTPVIPPVLEVPVVPEALKPPAGQRLSLEAVGIGVQIYECRPAKDNPERFEWVFKAPEADLFDKASTRIGRHYAGPTWEANDGSKVIGEIKGRDNGPDPNAIPWLLLNAKSTSGTGVFDRTLSIQRLRTVGGKAPAEGCDRTQAGIETRVAYEAGYYFYTAGP